MSEITDQLGLIARVAVTALGESLSPSEECLGLAAAAPSLLTSDAALLDGFYGRESDTRALAATLAGFADTGDDERVLLSTIIEAIGPDPRAVAAWGSVHPITVVSMIVFAGSVFDGFSPCTARVENALVLLLADESAMVRQRAAMTYGMLSRDYDIAAKRLGAMAGEDASGVAAMGGLVGLLFLYGTDYGPGLDTIREAARWDPDWQVRAAAGYILALLSVGAPTALRDVDDRAKTVTLSGFGINLPDGYVPEVLTILRDGNADPGLKLSAAGVLAGSSDAELSTTGIGAIRSFAKDSAFSAHAPLLDVYLQAFGSGEA